MQSLIVGSPAQRPVHVPNAARRRAACYDAPVNRVAPLISLLFVAACGGAPAPAVEPEAPAEPTSGAEQPAESETEKPAEPAAAVERLYRIQDDVTAPSKGGAEATVVAHVFSDFQCPYCAALAPTLHGLAEAYGDKLRIVWRHFPLPFHERAMPAAEAAVEVQAQVGSAGFWKLHDLMFAQQDQLGDEQLAALAGQIEGVDVTKVADALASHVHVPRVQSDMQAALDSGAGTEGFGTPTVFINGRLISGAQPLEVFKTAVDFALAETPQARETAEQASEAAYPMVRARHVLVQYVGAARAPETIKRSKEEALAHAKQVAELARAEGADFAALAREHSDGPSGPEGGLLGWLTRGTLMPSFEEAAFALAPGQVSDVVETVFGYHVILREQ